MAFTKHPIENIFFGLAISACIILFIIFYRASNGLLSLELEFLTFCLAAVWIIQALINRKLDRQPQRPLTPAEMQRYKVMRLVIGLGLIAMVIFAVASS